MKFKFTRTRSGSWKANYWGEDYRGNYFNYTFLYVRFSDIINDYHR